MPEKTNACFSLLMSKCSGSQLGLHQLPIASNSANFCNNTDNKKLDTQKKIYEQHLLVFPAVWWKYNASRFPILAKVVQMYLAPPPTSVPSERLFSVSGDVISEHRTRLNPDNAEKLIFMKYNASLIRLTDGMSSE